MAFPAISCSDHSDWHARGGGYPHAEAASIAIRTVMNAETTVQEIRFVLFSEAIYQPFHGQLVRGSGA